MRCRTVLLVVCLLGLAAAPAHGRPELAVMMGLGEVEWRVMRERIFPPFEQQHNVSIRGIQVEAPDAVWKSI